MNREPLRTFGTLPWLCALLLVGVLAACGSPGTTAPDDPTGPLTALPECDDPPPAADDGPVDDLVVPDDTVIVSVSGQDPLVSVAGYVEMTPIQVRLDYEQRDDIDLHASEDEVFESELLLSNDGYRTFVRATAACDQGSNLMVVVAPDTEAEGLPVPRGDGTTTD